MKKSSLLLFDRIDFESSCVLIGLGETYSYKYEIYKGIMTNVKIDRYE